jgi:ABC-2 type transport system ATP-binding protein
VEPLVSLEHVTKFFHRGRERSNWRMLIPGPMGEVRRAHSFTALDDVSMTIEPGRAVGLLGLNGAGKSTLLKVMAGVLRPNIGSVATRGRMASVIELGVGFAPDDTGRENLEFAGRLLGMTTAELRRKEEEIVEFAGLAHALDTPVKRYSSGMKSRLGFALVSSVPADAYLFDEVFAVGDWKFKQSCFERLAALNAEGAALVLVSHEHWILTQVCQELHLLEDGALVASGDPLTVSNRFLGEDSLAEKDPDIPVPLQPMWEVSDHQPVDIEDLEVVPEALHPGDPMEVRATIVVHEPVSGQLVLTIAMFGRTAFAEPETCPVDFLGTPGRYEVRATLDKTPIDSGRFEMRMAVVPEDDGDPNQEFGNAYAVARSNFSMIGGVNNRPGFKFMFEWGVDDAPAPAGAALTAFAARLPELVGGSVGGEAGGPVDEDAT